MASTQTDRIGTVDSSKAIKVPCRVATTADLTPSLSGGALGSGGGGLFTIDGVALAAGDRVLVKNQADQTTNGIYVATSTAWQRATDFQDNRAVVSGTIVLVTSGTASAGLWFELTTANPITIGSSNITFAVTSNPSVSSAMAPVVGAATLAQARTAIGTTTVGDALFTAASASAARVTLGYPSAAGTLAGESIGQGVEDDGAGNLRVKLDSTTGADAIVRSANGIKVDSSFMRGYLSGLTLSNDGTTPNTKVDIAAGVCVDDTQAAFLKSSGSIIVDFGTTGANGLDTGALADSTWYHLFLIGKTDGTVAGFGSTSMSPTLPSGYSYKRRLGSVKTDGSAHLLSFTQDGDDFWWKVPVQDVSSGTLSTANRTLTTVSVPSGVNVRGMFSAALTSAGGNAACI